MMRLRSLVAALALGSLVVAGSATAQPAPPQPPQPGGQQPPPRPPVQPAPPGQGGQPRPPGPVRPIGPHGGPGVLTRPGAPPGQPAQPDKPETKEEAEPECHGNYDHPAPVNWYQGIFGVNNDKALNGSGLEKLLYRYNNEANECDEHNQAPPLLGQVFNFSIFAFLLFFFGRKPIRDGLKNRKGALMGDIDAAEALRKDAELRLKSYQKQLVNIGARRTELEEEYQAQSEAERKRILAEADEKRARMIKDAEARVQQELRHAQGELLREAISDAVAAAEELLRKSVEQRDQERLADEYLTGLGSALSRGTAARTSTGGAGVSYDAIGRRYARALFDLGKEENNLPTLASNFVDIAATYHASQELRSVLDDPLVAHETRTKILADIATRIGAAPTAERALRVIAGHRRLRALPDIARHLTRMVDDDAKVVRATVHSAGPLSDAYLARLKTELEKATGSKVTIEHTVDPSLIAGVVTQIGDRVVDGSALARLRSIRATELS